MLWPHDLCSITELNCGDWASLSWLVPSVPRVGMIMAPYYTDKCGNLRRLHAQLKLGYLMRLRKWRWDNAWHSITEISTWSGVGEELVTFHPPMGNGHFRVGLGLISQTIRSSPKEDKENVPQGLRIWYSPSSWINWAIDIMNTLPEVKGHSRLDIVQYPTRWSSLTFLSLIRADQALAGVMKE